MPITIRKADKDDVPTILKLIHDLAEHLKGRKIVEVTLEQLYKDGGFDSNNHRPYFISFLAEDSDLSGPNEPPVAIGQAMCSYMYTWKGVSMYMNDLFVKDTHRSQGVGKLLFDAVVEHCSEMGIKRLEFLVYDWNPVQEFYEKCGAVNVTKRDGYQVFRLTDIEPLKKK